MALGIKSRGKPLIDYMVQWKWRNPDLYNKAIGKVVFDSSLKTETIKATDVIMAVNKIKERHGCTCKGVGGNSKMIMIVSVFPCIKREVK